MRLEGKRALVTGSSSGIGEAIVTVAAGASRSTVVSIQPPSPR